MISFTNPDTGKSYLFTVDALKSMEHSLNKAKEKGAKGMLMYMDVGQHSSPFRMQWTPIEECEQIIKTGLAKANDNQ